MSAAARQGGLLPDGTTVPSQTIQAPASVSDGGVTGSVGGIDGNAAQIVATSSTNGIPSAALAAYQRAETVINAADPSCHLTWQLVAGIGRVESNHGRYGGNVLDTDGIARPGILGPALTGKGGTTLVRDTDAGQYDGDASFDRAVGPMQFIPSTWSVVGVDADNDGVRNPQDIDDAALATAVYLCSGDDDLATLTGQKAAVFRYNHSASYVALVLSVMDAYLQGDYSQVPNGTLAAGYLAQDPTYHPVHLQPTNHGQQTGADQPSGSGSGSGSTSDPTSDPTTGGGDRPSPTLPSVPVTVPALPHTSIAPVDQLLTYAAAVVQCTLDGYVDNLLVDDDDFDLCVTDYTTEGGTRP